MFESRKELIFEKCKDKLSSWRYGISFFDLLDTDEVFVDVNHKPEILPGNIIEGYDGISLYVLAPWSKEHMSSKYVSYCMITANDKSFILEDIIVIPRLSKPTNICYNPLTALDLLWTNSVIQQDKLG